MNWTKLSELLYPTTFETIKDLMIKYPKRTLPENAEVVRFAPSPTGYLHIGGLYQTILDSSIANGNGIFYFRLEDTDQKRLNEEAKKLIFKLLAQFDITANEGYTIGGKYGPYAQSERIEIYNVFAKELVRVGRAMPCFCGENESKKDVEERRLEQFSKENNAKIVDPCFSLSIEEIQEKIDKGEKWALRFVSHGDDKNLFDFYDEIKGLRTLHQNTDDAVLIKSNGLPVYAFAHLVDDTLMGTTIVVRGEDWWSSLPLHIELFKTLNLPVLKYAHTPNIMILDQATGNKRKISKRKDPEADVRYFLAKGYPVSAVKEYLMNLLNSNFEPWRNANPDLPFNEFHFELKNVGTSNPLFDEIKLQDISKNLIAKMTAEQVYSQCLEYAQNFDKVLQTELENDKEKWIQIFGIDRGGEKPRKDIAYFSQITTYFDYFLSNFEKVKIDNVDNEKIKSLLTNKEVQRFINNYAQNYKEQGNNSDWFNELKKIAIQNNFAENKEYKLDPQKYLGNISDSAMIIRYLITKKTDSPNLYDIMKILGEADCKNRLEFYI